MRAPKRLIEVDLPIRRISAHARREKSIRHGHISTLHIWWARRPLAACRAVLCAALWPDPADPDCPAAFRSAAADTLTDFGKLVTSNPKLFVSADATNRPRWTALGKGEQALDPGNEADLLTLRGLLLDFIAEFANWDNSTVAAFLDTARRLTQAAHEALGGEPGTRPLVADPFAGGGSIPLEALRVGADAFASDLNPVAVLLNKVVLEYIPRFGQELADDVRKWGKWVKEKAEKELSAFYPKDPDGSTPIAYLWARTITCEGPACGAAVPLIRSYWLAKKGNRSVALKVLPRPDHKRVDIEIVEDAKAAEGAGGTVRRGSVTCPVCGFTTPVTSVRRQLAGRRGGTADARLLSVITVRPSDAGVGYRLPTERDIVAICEARRELERRTQAHRGQMSLVPGEPTPEGGGTGAGRAFSQRYYGMNHYCDLFTSRQQLLLSTLATLIDQAGTEAAKQAAPEIGAATSTVLSMALGKLADFSSSLCTWRMTRSCVRGTFTRQALPITWDFGEMNPFAGSAGDWEEACRYLGLLVDEVARAQMSPGQVQLASATEHPLPDGIANAFVTDPPYYDAVPYADLSDYFYVWHKRALRSHRLDVLSTPLSPKEDEAIMDPASRSRRGEPKDAAYYESAMRRAMEHGCRILNPTGIGIVVFAHKSTSGWEAILQSVIDSGWVITGSWPVDTERPGRLRSQGSAALASSVHLVCRPRPTASVGDWRDVLAELPGRIHQWMPRLADEGVVGADAIFACLGPALEIYSQYSSVEKATGEPVTLREYLEQVWAAVAKEALAMILNGGDASGFEEDARLSVIWFWVLKSANGEKHDSGADAEAESDEAGNEADEAEGDGKPAKVSGWQMEYDAVRKLAQGLGADLGRLSKADGIITITGKLAVLRTVESRQFSLLGVDRAKKAAEPALVETEETLFGPQPKSAKKAKRVRKPKEPTVTMKAVENRREALTDEPAELPGLFAGVEDTRTLMQRMAESGTTVLDRLHQSMLLFGLSQTALLGPFLTETRMGSDVRFWRLAQALSALYPAGTEEKRWVDGVLARKKGLGY